MWFKRRKKSEQDHALSESLRSLQSLLNDTGRQEPQLDAVDDGEAGSGDTPGGREPELAGGAGPGLEGGLDSAEPTPPEPGNRWRELSLSFDAEPLIPKAVEPVSTGDAEASEDPQDMAQADAQWGEDDGDMEPAVGAAPTIPSNDDMEAPQAPLEYQAADEERDEAGVEPVIGTTSSLWSDEDAEAADGPLEVREADGVYDANDGQDESQDEDEGEAEPAGRAMAGEPAEPVPQAPEPPTSDAPDAELELYSLDSDDDEAALPHNESVEEEDPLHGHGTGDENAEIETAPDPEPRPAAAVSTTATTTQRLEDQLDLQLESTDDPGDADIPTLTQAVYVPDAPLDAPDPAPVEPARDTSLVEDIEDLRSRLRNVDLDALSPEQQTRLHKGLSELLDKLE